MQRMLDHLRTHPDMGIKNLTARTEAPFDGEPTPFRVTWHVGRNRPDADVFVPYIELAPLDEQAWANTEFITRSTGKEPHVSA